MNIRSKLLGKARPCSDFITFPKNNHSFVFIFCEEWFYFIFPMKLLQKDPRRRIGGTSMLSRLKFFSGLIDFYKVELRQVSPMLSNMNYHNDNSIWSGILVFKTSSMQQEYTTFTKNHISSQKKDKCLTMVVHDMAQRSLRNSILLFYGAHEC